MAFHHTWPFNQDYWLLFLKVSFDGVTKLITVNSNESVIDVKEDLYSAWKRWIQTRDNL